MSDALEVMRTWKARAGLIAKAKKGRFLDIPLSELSRDDLLMVIGYLGEERQRDQRLQDAEFAMETEFHKARKSRSSSR